MTTSVSLLRSGGSHRPGLSLADLAVLVRDTASDIDAWLPKLRLPDGGERWWTRLSATNDVDIWLLSWLPGHATDLHDHGSSAAAFTVLRGRLSEVRIHQGGRRTHAARHPGSVTWLAPGVIHDVRGAGRGPAVSMHAYSPPITRMNYYADGRDGLHIVRSVPTHQPEQEQHR
jgi:predicted metal-dependent enzyme (double-stranded beta helix superfamily)